MVQYNKNWECPDHDTGFVEAVKMCVRIFTENVDGFLLFLSWLRGINLEME